MHFFFITLMYKEEPLDGKVLFKTGGEYYNNSLPFKGVSLTYPSNSRTSLLTA